MLFALLTASVSDSLSKKEVSMQTVKKVFSVFAVSVALASILGSIGCNTVRGMGRDIERGGEKTQDAAESVQRRL
jgi:entericidin B